ncbi:MAG TPA: DUF167 domain-containing protein [Candidatus Paceibacterota bacterium]|nr:DUF167 domain-containing protein [Candidatus Paceibacterota bacterium]
MERRITVRVTPRARHARVFRRSEDEYDIAVTAPPEHGRATDASRRALAAELGVAPSRISLIMGERSRTKVFRVT